MVSETAQRLVNITLQKEINASDLGAFNNFSENLVKRENINSLLIALHSVGVKALKLVKQS